VNGKLSSYKGSIPSLSLLDLAELELAIRKLDRMASRVPLDAPHRASEAEDWDGRSVESFKGVVPGARRGKLLIDVGVRTVFGAEPCELSLLYFLFYLNSAGGLRQLVEVEGAAQQDRFVTGAQKLSLGVAGKLDERRIVTNAPVSMITQEASGVAVHSARGVFRARYAVLAVPPHLASRVRFDPPLPPARDGLVQRWPMGATVKAMAFYSRASWRERGLSGEAVVTGGPISVVYDNSSHDGTVSCLLGFVVGRHARAWSKHDPSERRRIALAEFERLLGAPSSEAIDFIEQDWSSEPWTGGCPVASLPPRALSYFGDALRAPAGRVHFAGTETARHWCGYLEGALESAERAAAEVLARLVSELARTA
jgi:monoamine oxidase